MRPAGRKQPGVRLALALLIMILCLSGCGSKVVITAGFQDDIVLRVGEEEIDLPLLEFLAGDPVPKALLAVYETSGSTPVKSGAMMAVDRVNRTAGTIGGGCSENAVLNTARTLIGTGTQVSVTVDMSNDLAEEEGMVCGGRMKVLVADVSTEE